METQNVKSRNNLLSTREELLINNLDFPALEHYNEQSKELKIAYVKWLKNEGLGKHVCYIDLTFEIPQKGATTLSIVPKKENLEIYDGILNDFISNENTLYPHPVFQEGMKAYLKNGIREILKSDQKDENQECSESFFLHEIKNNNESIEPKKELDFFTNQIELEGFYTVDYLKRINDISIEDHLAKWVELHENLDSKKQSLTSNGGGVLKWVLVVPLGIMSENGNYKNIGSIFLGMDNKCKKDDVIYFTRSLILLLLSSSQRYYEKTALNNSIKSAVAAIMARNMSHNLGSHVFYYVRNEISKLAESGDENSLLTPTHKGLVKFLQYVQERQDFVATITSQDEYFFAPLNLKLDVLDEITPDAVDKRHNSKPPSTNFVLKYLVNSESIARHDNEIISNLIKEIEIEILFKGNSFKSKDATVRAVDFYDIDIAVQGGQQSRHAFLIIIENIIRNAAKHGFDKTLSDELKIQLRIDEIDDNYEIIISDNCMNSSVAKTIIQGYLDNLKILGTSNEESINREHKGLKEILVCVAWLKGVGLSKVFKPVSGIYDNLLTVVDVEGNLGYKFTLPVFNKTIEINEKDIIELKSKHSLYKKFGLVYTCAPELLEKTQKYFSRCVPNTIKRDAHWKYLSKIKYDSIFHDDLPAIIFERKGIQMDEGLFYFVENETELASKVDLLAEKKYILFKNHLAKSDDSLSKFFDATNITTLFNGNNPVFVENLSGATYSFNLFQISQNIDRQQEIYYRILEAFCTKIVIIDERLCPIDTPFIDELFELINDSSKIKEFVFKYFNVKSQTFINKLIEVLKSSQIDIQAELLKWWDNIDNAYKKQAGQSKLLNISNEYMKQRNIYLYTMDKAGNPFDQDGERLDSFNDLKPHFLSIHIGLLDKLIEFENRKQTSTKDKLQILKEKLGIPDMTHIAVHSGRGGLTDKNKDITFIPFANLQWAFENSKFMLSELFHNQIYFPI